MINNEFKLILSLTLCVVIATTAVTSIYLFEATEYGFEVKINDFKTNANFTFSIQNLYSFPTHFNYACFLKDINNREYMYFQDFFIISPHDTYTEKIFLEDVDKISIVSCHISDYSGNEKLIKFSL